MRGSPFVMLWMYACTPRVIAPPDDDVEIAAACSGGECLNIGPEKLALSCPANGTSLECLACTLTILASDGSVTTAPNATQIEVSFTHSASPPTSVTFSDASCQSVQTEFTIYFSTATFYVRAPHGTLNLATTNSSLLAEASADISIGSSAPTDVTLSSSAPLWRVVIIDEPPALTGAGVALPTTGGVARPTNFAGGGNLAFLTKTFPDPTRVDVPGLVAAATTPAFDATAPYSVELSAGATFPPNSAGTCTVLAPQTPDTCSLGTFDFATDVLSGGGLQLQAATSGGFPDDVATSNVLPTRVVTFRALLDRDPTLDEVIGFAPVALDADLFFCSSLSNGTDAAIFHHSLATGAVERLLNVVDCDNGFSSARGFGSRVLFSSSGAGGSNKKVYVIADGGAGYTVSRLTNFTNGGSDPLSVTKIAGNLAYAVDTSTYEVFRVDADLDIELASDIDYLTLEHFNPDDQCLYESGRVSSTTTLRRLCPTGGPAILADIESVNVLGKHGDKILFTAREDTYVKLFAYEPSTASYGELLDVDPGQSDFISVFYERSHDLLTHDDKLVLTLQQFGGPLYLFDPHATAPTLTQITPELITNVDAQTSLNGRLFFVGDNNYGGSKLYRYDAATTPVLKELGTTEANNTREHAVSLVRGEHLFVAANISSGNRFMYVYDDSADRLLQLTTRQLSHSVTPYGVSELFAPYGNGYIMRMKNQAGQWRLYHMTISE